MTTQEQSVKYHFVASLSFILHKSSLNKDKALEEVMTMSELQE